ncbi:hypothetical protein D3C75_1012030 [compost metagenome]
MKNTKSKHRIVMLTNKLDLLRLEQVRATLAKVLFNPSLMLLILVCIVRLRE